MTLHKFDMDWEITSGELKDWYCRTRIEFNELPDSHDHVLIIHNIRQIVPSYRRQLSHHLFSSKKQKAGPLSKNTTEKSSHERDNTSATFAQKQVSSGGHLNRDSAIPLICRSGSAGSESYPTGASYPATTRGGGSEWRRRIDVDG